MIEHMNLISQYIAPWALPKEDIPLHLIWEPAFPCDRIIINIPYDIIVKEFFNVDSVTHENNQFIIEKLKTPNFFGLTVASKEIIKEQHISRKIDIQFLKDEKTIYSQNFIANIYRPYLTIVKNPTSVTITEKTNLRDLVKIILKLSGFGYIQIRNEISTGGEFIERAEPLYREFVRRIISTFKLEELQLNNKGIRINPLYLQRKTKVYLDRIEKGIFPLDFKQEDLQDFREWVVKENNKDKIMELISRNIENLIVDSLLFYFEKYPENNIQMPQGKPVMLIKSATQKVRIRFRYTDSMLNEYKSIEIPIEINDNRENKTQPIELPINIKWLIEVVNPLEESA